MRVTVTPKQVRAAFDAVSSDPSFAESRRLAESGQLPVEMLQAMSLRPELLRAFAGFGDSVYPGGLLERSLKELVILQSSLDNGCQFCTHSHVALIQQLGIAAEPLQALEDNDARTPREQLALEYTRSAMQDSNRVPDELFDRLKQLFSEPEIVELTFLIGFINMLNLFNNCLQVHYHDDYAAFESNGHEQNTQPASMTKPSSTLFADESPSSKIASPKTTPSKTATSTVRIWCDGACAGNPGPGGWGCIVETNGQRHEYSGGNPRTTNNQMELQALIEALKNVPSGTGVQIETDSEYLSKGITQWMRGWIRNGWKTAAKQPVKNQEQWQQLHALLQERPHKVSWVRGHAGHPENERCDELARTAIKQVTGKTRL
ncbi:MAG TPA: ribonuclease HI [Abditibacteriaceae bacterium]|jgi:ribonuclease HI